MGEIKSLVNFGVFGHLAIKIYEMREENGNRN